MPLTTVNAKQRASSSSQGGNECGWLPTQEFYFRESKKMGTEIYIQATPLSLFTTVTNWKQPKCPSVGDWVNKVETTPSVAYAAIKDRRTFNDRKNYSCWYEMGANQAMLPYWVWSYHAWNWKTDRRKYMRIFPVVASGREIGGDFCFHLNFLCFFCLFWSSIERGYAVYHLGLAVFTQDYVTTLFSMGIWVHATILLLE